MRAHPLPVIPAGHLLRLSLTALLASACLALPRVAHAGDPIVVNSTDNELNTDGDCALREAVEAANTNLAVDNCAAGDALSPDSITFNLATGSIITLSASIDINQDVTIDGGASAPIIDMNQSDRAFTVAGAPVTFASFSIINGLSFGAGGAIDSDSPITLSYMTLHNNRSNDTTLGGGAVHASAQAVIQNSTFQSNSALGHGGAVLAQALAVDGGLFDGNSAGKTGGALTSNSTAQLNDVTLARNTAVSHGGGLMTSGSVTVMRGAFDNNRSTNGRGGGISASALMIDGTAFVNNIAQTSGGAITASGPVSLQNASLERNRVIAGAGGALQTLQTAAITSSVFLSNTAQSGGGALIVGTSSLSNVTFELNVGFGGPGGGLMALAASTVRGGAFLNNHALQGGGLYGNQSVDFANTRFIANSAMQSGGGMYVAGAATSSQAEFVDNTAGTNGGGAYFANSADLSGQLFARNTTTQTGSQGGALFVAQTGNLTLARTDLVENTAAGSGGALAQRGGTLTISQSRFVANKSASGDGSGLHYAGTGAGTATLTNVLFARNQTQNSGVVLDLSALASTSIQQVTIASPTLASGAAVRANTAHATLINTLIASHTVGVLNVAGFATSTHSLYFDVGTPFSGLSSVINTAAGDPRFIDPGTDDYHLGKNSAARDAGVFAGIFSDYDGHFRPSLGGFDIGYDERQIQFISGLGAGSDAPKPAGIPVNFYVGQQAGDDVSYHWNFGDGTLGTGDAPAHLYAAAGSYTVIVTATNEAGSAVTSLEVTVTDSPIDSLSAGNDSPKPAGSPVTFNGLQQGGENVAYRWEFGDGVSSTASPGPSATHAYTQAGIYTAVLAAYNGSGFQYAETVVTITTATAMNLGIQQDSAAVVGQPASFSATPALGNDVTYTWRVNGVVAGGNGATFSHVFPTAGVYDVSVTADNGSGTASASMRVTVSPSSQRRVYLALLAR